jgi:two-component system chemotaxis response regulator CheB
MAFELVVIGTSLGGLHALETVLKGLPRQFPLPVVIVQHRSKDTINMAALLQRYSLLPVREVEDKEEIQPGWVYLAPADYHLLVEAGHFALSLEAPVWFARPSIDILFESVAEAYAGRVIGVILTGASQDGARGLAKIKAAGGLAVVQSPATAESRIMPEAAIAATQVDQILPLTEIALFLTTLCLREMKNEK